MDSRSISRRQLLGRLLGHLGFGAAWAGAGRVFSIRSAAASGAPGLAPKLAVEPALKEPRRGDVQLGEGPMLAQFQQQQRLFLNIDDDRLLKPFRVRAGQPAPGADMGGWYDQSADFHIDPKNWSTANWHGFIPGHSFGQYLSGLAQGLRQHRRPGCKGQGRAAGEQVCPDHLPSLLRRLQPARVHLRQAGRRAHRRLSPCGRRRGSRTRWTR